MQVENMRVVVVGASSGLGRSIGLYLARQGCRVAFLGRRLERLNSAAEEAGEGACGVECDVADEESCRSGINAAAQELGGIDGLVYCAGIGPLGPIAETDAATWRRAFDTNVIGATVATAAALPYLIESGGSALYLSSISASVTPPWPGLSSYAVSKAALDKLVEAWRAEHPTLNFTRVIVGETMGGPGEGASEFSSGWDPEHAGAFYPIWAQRGYLSGGLINVEELAVMIETVLNCSGSVPSVTVAPLAPSTAG